MSRALRILSSTEQLLQHMFLHDVAQTLALTCAGRGGGDGERWKGFIQVNKNHDIGFPLVG